MAEMKIEAAISVPDKPDGLDIPDVAWEQIVKNVWIHYHQSLADFAKKMFEAVGQAAGVVAPSDVRVETTSTDSQLQTFVAGKRKRKSRQEKNGAYVTCKWLGDKTGYSPETIRKIFLRQKTGVHKRTFSGRNRKVYTVMRISRVAAKLRFPDLEI